MIKIEEERVALWLEEELEEGQEGEVEEEEARFRDRVKVQRRTEMERSHPCGLWEASFPRSKGEDLVSRGIGRRAGRRRGRK